MALKYQHTVYPHKNWLLSSKIAYTLYIHYPFVCPKYITKISMSVDHIALVIYWRYIEY